MNKPTNRIEPEKPENLTSLMAKIFPIKDDSNPVKVLFSSNSKEPLILQRATPGSAGYDIPSHINCTLPPRSRKSIPTGIQLILPRGKYARIFSRSGLSFNHGIEVGAGVVDSDFRGEIFIILYNHSDQPYTIKVGQNIAQMVIMQHEICHFIQIPYNTTLQQAETEYNESLNASASQRQQGGFGSTDLS